MKDAAPTFKDSPAELLCYLIVNLSTPYLFIFYLFPFYLIMFYYYLLGILTINYHVIVYKEFNT